MSRKITFAICEYIFNHIIDVMHCIIVPIINLLRNLKLWINDNITTFCDWLLMMKMILNCIFVWRAVGWDLATIKWSTNEVI